MFIHLVQSLDWELNKDYCYHLNFLIHLLIAVESKLMTHCVRARCRVSHDQKLLHLKVSYNNRPPAEKHELILSLLANPWSWINLSDLFKEVMLLSSLSSQSIICDYFFLWQDYLKILFYCRGSDYWICWRFMTF